MTEVSRLRVKLFFFLAIVVFNLGLLELALRSVRFFVREPLRSVLQEATLSHKSALNVYGPLRSGVAIRLPRRHTVDILSVGDSITFGTLVDPKDTFTAIVAKNEGLTQVNLGVSGAAPDQYNRMLEVGARYQPRFVLYNLFANEFVYNRKPDVRPLLDSNIDAHLPGDESLFIEKMGAGDYVRAFLRRAYYSSAILKWLNWGFLKPKGHPGIAWYEGDLHYEFASSAYWANQLGWNREWVKAGTEINIQLIKHAYEFAKSRDARLIVFLHPSKEMVYGPMIPHGERIYADSQHQTYRELLSRLKDLNIEGYDLTPYLRQKAEEKLPLYHVVDGHYTEIGHREVAAFIEDYIHTTGLAKN